MSSNELSPDNAAAAAKQIKGATIALSSGSYFDYLNPSATTMTIEDYAYALAYTVRFRGQCKQNGQHVFYSVAQHCVIGAHHLMADGHGAINALAFLGHESDEVPFGDMPGPTKPLFAEWKAITKPVGEALDRHFNIPAGDRDLLKRYDLRMLATEKRDLMAHCHAEEWELVAGYEPFNRTIQPAYHPDLAAQDFLILWDNLVAYAGLQASSGRTVD